MIRYREIAFTAYPVTDIDRARKFYEGVLGLKPNAPIKPGTKFIEYDIGPGTLAIGASPNWPPSNDGPSAALEVEDFDAAVATLREHKIDFIIGPMETPVCHMVAMRDPDGNRISLHRRKSR
jgi:predicted enzyme related to lactoylglutathione lyase